ncbi:fused isobutyryl-CoA mutase/GTPase IcmF [Candidatus Spongiihabitans sp.]|uniref:fused isobutyryl-CoA mutase/GTPase IcmF n=1 Tax=Candidatus Spongiihabitans sp. TaxID=3101308 RepID=UPI003C6FEAC2
MGKTILSRADPLPAKAISNIRFVTAASLFDGHDAAINIMRRILQASGVEVIHLGHNRSVAEVVNAALQEDVHGIALSSYQGGHVEYLKYMMDMLRQNGGDKIRVFAGGGGVIVAQEKAILEEYGVTRIYAPEDGQALGLSGMIENAIALSQFDTAVDAPQILQPLVNGDRRALSQVLSALENGAATSELPSELPSELARRIAHYNHHSADKIPVLGITGTGGAGKSSLTDELILRFRLGFDDGLKIAIIAVDPTRRRTGGALLGDRIRMNAINHDNIYMRSVATRGSNTELPEYVSDMIGACKVTGFDLIIVETPGIGQGNAGISSLVDCSLYVMTPEFGAQSQLEKIDMLDFADVVAINKFDRKGAADAYRDVCKQVQRNRGAFSANPMEMPVFGTIAARFNDDGLTALYQEILSQFDDGGWSFLSNEMPNKSANKSVSKASNRLPVVTTRYSTDQHKIIPEKSIRYLAEISETVRDYKILALSESQKAREIQQLESSLSMLVDSGHTDNQSLELLVAEKKSMLGPESAAQLTAWQQLKQDYANDELVVVIRDREIATRLKFETLSGTKVSKVALPGYADHGERLKWLMLDNLPGRFPFTAGVFPFKRSNEDPTRMFAGEGDAFKTNQRFRKLSEYSEAKRLSTAFDSVTLYGCDPDERPDIYGKVGNSGVSIATVDDLKALYEGFDLCCPTTSVSMTINGPAPIILAMFLNVAIDQQVAAFTANQGTIPNAEQAAEIRSAALAKVRGTVQADILKEDQGQNTCIFSTEFALKLMGDIQAYFTDNQIRNFYSVSISGYHIAEAGANPISQLAFTLANGFTYVEAYLARGMHIDDFAGNLSFFFSNGMCSEYTVMGRVARRIWAVAMRDRYGANERSQKLKYHIQTSGRSLHAQEMDFNDIRTSLQALIAIYDNCNSLHTNAFDEAITTPTDESVRRAMAIQLIINNEWGLAMNENPNQGSFIIDELTELLEEAVLTEFERISERGGVLGAMETGYQRGKIQDQSIAYEQRKHDGSLPIIGVNTFLNANRANPVEVAGRMALSRSTEQEKQSQIKRLRSFQQKNRAHCDDALTRVKHAAINNENIFTQLMVAVRHCSLGQISEALYEVGGQYRRNM